MQAGADGFDGVFDLGVSRVVIGTAALEDPDLVRQASADFPGGIVVAVERGTPLADVLRAQAQDVRELGRRAILEEGGRKEIAMMVPVVFLVLPITILFALYPGFVALKFTL